MILEFVDKSQIEVITILGGPANINGIIRDVLTIEISKSTTYLDKLKEIFENIDNLARLYSYEEERNENDDILMNRIEIGEGYTIVVGIEEISRKVIPFPGKIVPDTYETIYQVQLAQMTYDEWIASGYNLTE